MTPLVGIRWVLAIIALILVILFLVSVPAHVNLLAYALLCTIVAIFVPAA